MSPGEDEASRALLTVHDDPDAAVVIRLIHENIDNRIWYLGQMLEATEAFISMLESR